MLDVEKALQTKGVHALYRIANYKVNKIFLSNPSVDHQTFMIKTLKTTLMDLPSI